jgi:hypothetical protein
MTSDVILRIKSKSPELTVWIIDIIDILRYTK